MTPCRPPVGPELAHWGVNVCANHGLSGAYALASGAASGRCESVVRLIADEVDDNIWLIGATP